MVFWEHREAECDTHSFVEGSRKGVSSACREKEKMSCITVSAFNKAKFVVFFASVMQTDCVYVVRSVCLQSSSVESDGLVNTIKSVR